MTKRILLAGGALGAVAVLVLVASVGRGAAQGASAPPDSGFVAPVDVDTAGLPGPRQPVFYRHDVHAGQYQMDCRYCHFAAEVSTSPGLPTIATCMGCHRIVGLQNPEVQKLRQAAASSQPIEWTEIHKLPPFVHFPHMRHVTSNLGTLAGKTTIEKCETCHGPIRQLPQVYQFASLKMGWCISCHTQAQKAAKTEDERQRIRTDCTVCHY